MAAMDICAKKPKTESGDVSLEVRNLSYQYGGGATFATRALSEPKLKDVNLEFPRGARVLVAGANGAGKSTLMSIMGGTKMVPRDQCKIFGKSVFHDGTLNSERMYCGDWWRTDFFFNLSVQELIGEELLASPRVQELIDIMQINTSWRINAISDGQRRRVQLLECLALEKSFYILDEITTDLDLYARESLLEFLRRESEEKGATIFYATHIFDYLAHWATDLLFFSQARVARCCTMADLHEYHSIIASGAKVPLYALMKAWVFKEYQEVPMIDPREGAPDVLAQEQPVLETRNLGYSYVAGSPQLSEVSFSFGRGQRILVIGANGAGKSTLLSILGGKRMVPRGYAFVNGKDCFNDATGGDIMYCGDWWRAAYFGNLYVHEILGEGGCTDPRTQYLVKVLQVDMNWKINFLSDGQRRRCQLLEILAKPRPVYLMDEITSDLDIYAREGILSFLRAESELRGATVFYCTHIFDHLEGWATHMLHMSKGRVVQQCVLSELQEYQCLLSSDNTPLYSLVREKIYEEYKNDAGEKPWRKVHETLDGRIPNLGLAGPTQAPASSIG
jgi:CCR4-NOT complex subunit CAF16